MMNRVLTHTDPDCSRCNHSIRMALVVLISLILLSLGFAGADEECVYAAIGKTKVIEHDYSGLELLEQSFHLRWTHDSKIVYDNKKDTAKKYQTTKNGSLLLENLQLDNAGTYQATIYDNLGNHMKSTVTRLCVLDDDSSAVLLFGMELWLMVLILAGGGCLLLILIIITLVCVCRSRRQHKRRLEEEKEMRLAPLTQHTRQANVHHQQRAQS